MKFNLTFVARLAVGLALITTARAVPVTLINDFETSAETSACSSSSGVSSTIVTSGAGVTHGTHALQLTFAAGATGTPTESITFAAQNWTNSGALGMNVYNPGTVDITFNVRIEDPLGSSATHSVSGSVTVKAGATVQVALPTLPSNALASIQSYFLFKKAMPPAPPAYLPATLPATPPTVAPDLTQMQAVRIYLGATNPATASVLVFDNLHLVPGPTTDLSLATSTVDDFETTVEQSLSTFTSGVAFSCVTSPGVTSGTHALRLDWLAGSGVGYPHFSLTTMPDAVGTPAAADWLGRNAIGFAFDAYNPNASAVTFSIKPVANGSTTHQGSATIAAGASATYIIPLHSRTPLNLPGYTNMTTTGSATFDFQHVGELSFFLGATAPATTTTLYIDNMRLVYGDLLAATVDIYGQNTYADWTGKAHSDTDLTTQLATENSDLSSHTVLPGLDTYSGWNGTGSPQLATGSYFRTQLVNGKWWLVDPLGHLFFGTGMDSMDCSLLAQSTRINATSPAVNRTGMFTGLPPTSGSPYSAFWGTYNGTIYNHYDENLYRKYGPTWSTQWVTKALARTKSWGFNMIGLWAATSLTPNTQVPYVLGFSTTNTTSKKIAGAEGTVPDPWDPALVTYCNSAFAGAASHKTDPWLIGYFIDNELGFGFVTTVYQYQYPLAYKVMLEDARVAGAFPAKDHLISLLQSRYTTITALNTAWGTSFTGWTDPVLLNAYTLPSGYLSLNASQVADFDAYMSVFAGQYYSVVRTALKASDPNHLYLGSRLASWTPPVYTAAALYCDVVSFNIYKPTLDSSWNFLDTLGKPAFVGEFNFAATDRGGFNTSLVAASSQADRAAKFQAYIASAMGHSGVVGCNWFQYVDEPITGRYFDGENSPMGFVSITDYPYPEMVAAARTVNATLYTGRY